MVNSYCEGLVLVNLVNLSRSADELKSHVEYFIELLLEQIVIFVALYIYSTL